MTTRIENKTFQGNEPTWANACVGDNGAPGIIDYASGFSLAANMLLESVIRDDGRKLPVDYLIYPICFNMRHAVELNLKSTVVYLNRIADLRFPIAQLDSVEIHDINLIWNHVKANAPILDVRYQPLVDVLDEYITDIGTIDSTGQVFRYPFDVDRLKHLTDVAIINCRVLKERFNQLETLLKALDVFNDSIFEEYRLGSSTKKLSRHQLFLLSIKLPNKELWIDVSFTDAKAKLMKEFGLSSNDFSKALNIITKHYEMSYFINAVPKIEGITEADLHTFFDAWVEEHDLEEIKNPKIEITEGLDYFAKEDFDEMKARWERQSVTLQELSEKLSPVAIGIIHAMYYFHIDMKYSEYFLGRMKIDVEEAEGKNTPQDFKQFIKHQLEKTGALNCILNTLNFLNQTELLDSLVKRYALENHIAHWLEESNHKKWRELA